MGPTAPAGLLKAALPGQSDVDRVPFARLHVGRPRPPLPHLRASAGGGAAGAAAALPSPATARHGLLARQPLARFLTVRIERDRVGAGVISASETNTPLIPPSSAFFARSNTPDLHSPVHR